MKITPTGPIGTGSVTAVRRTRTVSKTGAARGAEAYEATAAPRHIEDDATILGIPEAEVTPKVRDALVGLMREVEQMRRELQAARERLATLERLADRDPLVPIANRRAFVRELSRQMAHVERYGSTSSVVYIDVNDFKEINDSFGHTAGDEALRHIATILLQNVRESDLIGRFGGDEFGIILDQIDSATARIKAEALSEQIFNTPMLHNGRSIALRVAVDVHSFSGNEDIGHALAAADRDIYVHKRTLKDGKVA
jgi:diguanylate cyclase (GGDEF)-like protein